MAFDFLNLQITTFWLQNCRWKGAFSLCCQFCSALQGRLWRGGSLVAPSSYRFLFEYDGQEYVWTKKRSFAGDTLSCHNLTTGNHVACYTHKILPPKLQGVLTVEPTVRPALCMVQVALVMHSCALSTCVLQLPNATRQGKANGRKMTAPGSSKDTPCT